MITYYKFSKYYNSTLIAISISILLISCSSDLEVIKDLKFSDYQLVDIDSNDVVFPKLIENKIGVVGYIFTNCPDICPLTINNMRLIQEKLKADNVENVQFVSISFDPEVDKPSVLKGFSEVHGLNLSNWDFLTGSQNTIEKLLKQVGVIAFVGDSTTFDDGTKTYYYVHTDRIQLVDQDGKIRKNYLGSKINIDEIVEDVKKLN